MVNYTILPLSLRKTNASDRLTDCDGSYPISLAEYKFGYKLGDFTERW